MEQHKHKGVNNSTGGLRLHPVDRVHKDSYAKKCHTLALNTAKGKSETKKSSSIVNEVKKIFGKKTTEETTQGNCVMCQLDKEGYITMNLDNLPAKGVRLSFTRREGDKKRTVGLQIDNDPCKLKGGERIKGSKKLTVDKIVKMK